MFHVALTALVAFCFSDTKKTATRELATTTNKVKTIKVATSVKTKPSKSVTSRRNIWPTTVTTNPLTNMNPTKQQDSSSATTSKEITRPTNQTETSKPKTETPTKPAGQTPGISTNNPTTATMRSSLPSFFIVQTGDDVTLPTGNRFNQENCEGSTWIFADPETRESVVLVDSGQLTDIAETKLNRLLLAADCSLVIKNVSVHDVGSYTSRTFVLHQLQGPDFQIYVFIINLSEQKEDDRVTLFCSMLEFAHCSHSVRWMFEGEEEVTSEVEISTGSCSSNVTFSTTDPEQKSALYRSLKCEVMNPYTDEVRRFVFRPQASGEKSDLAYLVRCIIVSIGLAALIISVVRVEIWTKTKGQTVSQTVILKLEEIPGREESSQS
ncbi:PREDICTED: uncharacterized protein LOC106911619 [Poecilia mexicana]|uniref:uncharacterized protein LOC106911619 n=1 Tax=Poecilia mexicana TaxID=48701 RepID=UPI00072E78DC|nr:PREDICTED: uncharacterized protein LOC106911619 [Poecilia mexicana]